MSLRPKWRSSPVPLDVSKDLYPSPTWDYRWEFPSQKSHTFPPHPTSGQKVSKLRNFLSYEGRLTLVNYVFSQHPTFYRCLLKLPVAVLRQIDKYRRNYLWRSSASDYRGKPLIAWNKVCKPKKQGCLGILNLTVQNQALCLKNMHKFYNHTDLP